MPKALSIDQQNLICNKNIQQTLNTIKILHKQTQNCSEQYKARILTCVHQTYADIPKAKRLDASSFDSRFPVLVIKLKI